MNRGICLGRAVGILRAVLLGCLLGASQAAVAACYAEPSGVISWYRAESSAYDARGSNHGSNFGGYAAGRVGQAFSLNGTSDYVSVPDAAALEPTSVSVEAWVQFSSVPSLALIVSKPVGGTANSYSIAYQSGQLMAEISDGGSTRPRAQIGWTPTIGAWHHVAMTFEGAAQTLKLFIDGAEVASTAAGIPLYYGAGTNPLLIGAEDDGSGPVYFFPGLIDEVTLYGRALGAAEIASIHAAGSAGKCLPSLVTNTNDDLNPGSLRYAMTYVNSSCTAGPHSIAFDIPGVGPHLISVGSSLPAITCSDTVIDGFTQSGASKNTLTPGAGDWDNAVIKVQLDGGNTGSRRAFDAAVKVTIRGLSITQFDADAAYFNTCPGCVVEGCYINVTPAGASTPGGGIYLNGGAGIAIGGPAAAQQNLWAANGVYMNGPSGTFIEKNLFNIGRDGMAFSGNLSGTPLTVNASDNFIYDNHFAATTSTAVDLNGQSNDLVGNVFKDVTKGVYVGGTGLHYLYGNSFTDSGFEGLYVASGSPYNQIWANTVSGSGQSGSGYAGIYVNSYGNSLIDNAVVNGTWRGIEIADSDNYLYQNHVSGNAAAGIAVVGTATGNRLSRNRAYGNNDFPGIDLGGDGPTPNDESSTTYDADKPDNNANGLQNYPVVTSVTHSGGNTIVSGTLKTDAAPYSSPYVIVELFSNSSTPTTTQGETYIGQVLLAGFTSNVAYDWTATIAGTHYNVSAVTVIDQCSEGCYQSSEYSPAMSPPAPVLSLSVSSLAFGNLVVGTQSAPQTVIITNTGSGDLVLSSITAPAYFVVTGCSPPITIVAEESCTLSVRFAPGTTGAQSGNILISSNASGSPHSLGVSGTGTAPAVAGVSIAPSPAAFGSVVVGTSSTLNLTVTSTGNASLNVTAVTPSGTGFTSTSNCVGLLVAPGLTCQVSVTFAPTATGAHAGSVSVSSNASGSPHTVALSGTGTAPTISLSSSALAFGSQTVNSNSLSQSVTVTNTGTASLSISAVTIAGDFGFTGCASPLTLPPGASCTLSIHFFPTTTGNLAGSVSIVSNASGSPHAIGLSGTGTPLPVPGIALAPASANFGTILVGQSATQVLALSNPGTANLDIGAISVMEIVIPPAAMRAKGVSFSQTNDCPAALAPSAACNITVTYAPSVAGSHAGELHVISNAAPSPLVAALSGSANPATTPGLQLSASSVAFAPQFPNTTSAAQSVTLTSSGTAPLVITQVAASGDFGFSGCGPATLAPGATCSFAITFRPFSEGPHSGAIVITSNAPGSPHTLSLSGTGSPRLAPEISLSPSSFAFGPVRTQGTGTLASRLTNAGAAALEIAEISSTGSFFAQSNNCPSSLAIGASCDITVTYAPTATGPHSGQLVIHSNALPSPYIAALSGAGINVPPPFLHVDGALDFGQQATGMTVRRTLTLANTGGDPLTISQMTLIGSGVFGLEGACATIAPERSCDITVTFTPTGLAAFTARLDIVSNHSGGVVQVSLLGIGTALPRPALELSVSALGFGTQGVGSATASRNVRLTSVGAVAAQINSIAASLPDFVVDASQCPAALPPQQGCDIGVAFKPVAPGGRLGALVIQSDAVAEGGLPHSVSLIGVGCRFFTVGSSRNPQRLCAP